VPLAQPEDWTGFEKGKRQSLVFAHEVQLARVTFLVEQSSADKIHLGELEELDGGNSCMPQSKNLGGFFG
jgi:hypothetical protein